MKVINFLVLLIILIGALNAGLWGFFHFDFFAWICGGEASWLYRLIYAVIGLAGVWGLSFLGKCKAICCSSCDKQ